MSDRSTQAERTPRRPLFTLRTIAQRDVKHGMYVAYCLETGNVTTADDMETAIDMMREVLDDEVRYAMLNRSVKNLFSCPADFYWWRQWEAVLDEPQEIEANPSLTVLAKTIPDREVGHDR